MNTGKRMKQRRVELKLSADKVGEKIGVDRSTIYRYEKGEIEKLPIEILVPLSEVLQTTPAFLMGWEADINTIYNQLESSRQKKVYSFAEHQLEEQNKVIHIHKDNGDYVTETLRGYLSAGTGELQLEEVLEEVEVPVEIIPEQHYDMLLQINGDSMLPMFQDGERIFVRKIEDTGELRSGQIGVFIIDGESYLKKAYKEDNQLRLVSLNDKYDDLIFNEVNDIEVIGTVVM